MLKFWDANCGFKYILSINLKIVLYFFNFNISAKTAPTADMPVAKATAAEATVTAPKYPSGISVEKTLEKIRLWSKGTEEGGCRNLIWYFWLGIV